MTRSRLTHDDFPRITNIEVPSPDPSRMEVTELIPRAKTLACGKCGRDMTVSSRCVFAYCAACSDGMGVKK